MTGACPYLVVFVLGRCLRVALGLLWLVVVCSCRLVWWLLDFGFLNFEFCVGWWDILLGCVAGLHVGREFGGLFSLVALGFRVSVL